MERCEGGAIRGSKTKFVWRNAGVKVGQEPIKADAKECECHHATGLFDVTPPPSRKLEFSLTLATMRWQQQQSSSCAEATTETTEEGAEIFCRW